MWAIGTPSRGVGDDARLGAGAPLAAAALAADGVDFVVVGGCALVLRGLADRCGDLDIVPDPRSDNLDRLRDALQNLGAWALPRDLGVMRNVASATSPFGRIDVMLATAHAEYEALERDADACPFAGVPVRAASEVDVLRLKRRFKGETPC